MTYQHPLLCLSCNPKLGVWKPLRPSKLRPFPEAWDFGFQVPFLLMENFIFWYECVHACVILYLYGCILCLSIKVCLLLSASLRFYLPFNSSIGWENELNNTLDWWCHHSNLSTEYVFTSVSTVGYYGLQSKTVTETLSLRDQFC